MELPDQYTAWCERLKASDEAAYSDVFRATYDPLLRYAVSFTRDRAAAADIVQDVYVKLWEVRTTLDPKRSLKALLYRMVRNLSLNHQRDSLSHETKLTTLYAERIDTTVQPDDTIDTDMIAQQLRLWIDELPARQREALLLSRYEGLSHEEIALTMEVSPRTVNNHLVKALKHLRGRLRTFELTSLAS